MRYILLAAFSAVAFGQSPESATASALQDDRSAVLAAKATRLIHSAAKSAGEQDDGDAKGSPVLLQQVIRRSVQWTKTTAVCSSLKTDLTGSGQGRTTITLVRNPDGTINYKTNDEVSGTATDGDNRHYIFFYASNLIVESGSGIPRPQPPYDVYGTDTFQLIPVDGGAGYTTTAFFKARFNTDGSFTDHGSVLTPNLSCDPL